MGPGQDQPVTPPSRRALSSAATTVAAARRLVAFRAVAVAAFSSRPTSVAEVPAGRRREARRCSRGCERSAQAY
jgi:hypothetical protein